MSNIISLGSSTATNSPIATSPPHCSQKKKRGGKVIKPPTAFMTMKPGPQTTKKILFDNDPGYFGVEEGASLLCSMLKASWAARGETSGNWEEGSGAPGLGLSSQGGPWGRSHLGTICPRSLKAAGREEPMGCSTLCFLGKLCGQGSYGNKYKHLNKVSVLFSSTAQRAANTVC